ncbi:MAG TPA: NAD(P)H-hydrate dehydratase [Thermoanaerobaculia bacterium]|nr:NAD(P)H-hydrate dehydratase [Thermoanaerobaculia bacterium]
MIPVLDARAMRRADRAAIRSGTASSLLMENAAEALVRTFLDAYPDGRRVVIACGPGNNGGDGLAAARILSGRGLAVSVFTLRDPARYRGDAAENAARARAAGLALRSLESVAARAAFARELAEADGALDALFGTGLARPLQGHAARLVDVLNRCGRPIVAADLPSGLSSDTGARIGPSVAASRTVAFGAPKICHVAYPARERCGRVTVADIGISRRILDRMGRRFFLTESADVAAAIPRRRADSHKGDFGRLAVIAGSRGKAGAAILAARGALRAGAGLVTVFCPAALEAEIVGALPEAMTLGLPEEGGAIAASAWPAAASALRAFDAAVAGPGLSTARGAVGFLDHLRRWPRPLVLDADALNAFAGRPRAFATRAPRVLTPHPGEAARLLGISARAIQADRLGVARRLARRTRAVVVLKGAATLVAEPSGSVTVNPTGTPLMATAGSGDVLAGALGALLAGGMRAADAARTAVWLHGAAGELLACDLGDAGLLAHELADAIPRVRRDLVGGSTGHV